ncbi:MULTISPECIES: pentapeptide repeat-containing protein [Streptomyces]|uniref:pentapeptide repeat-containing protein n=1 Tax=Streptomyces TaxID=1883 RepID=UPI001558C215|nr:pentapeptide repeat-containing protein [Streptomyces kasugaensis]
MSQDAAVNCRGVPFTRELLEELKAAVGDTSGEASFGRARLLEPVDFTGVTFTGEAFFWLAHFADDALFYEAIFNRDGVFEDAVFELGGAFEHADFQGSAWFQDTLFSSDTDFEHARFSTGALFSRAQVFGEAAHSLAEREVVKSEELAHCRISGVSARTVRRKRQGYQAYGSYGLVDGRTKRAEVPGTRQDLRVVEALFIAQSDRLRSPLRSAGFYRRKTGLLLDDQYGSGAVHLPFRSTFQRLIKNIVAQHAATSDHLERSSDGLPSHRPHPQATHCAGTPGPA